MPRLKIREGSDSLEVYLKSETSGLPVKIQYNGTNYCLPVSSTIGSYNNKLRYRNGGTTYGVRTLGELIEDFEVITDWTHGGIGFMALSSAEKESGTYSMELSTPSGESTATKDDAVELSSVAELRFWWKMTLSIQGTAKFQIATDAAFTTPITLWTRTTTGSAVETIDVGDYTGNYYLRFSLSLAGGITEELYIDNLAIVPYTP